MSHYLPKSLRGSFKGLKSKPAKAIKIEPATPFGTLATPQELEVIDVTDESMTVQFRVPVNMAGVHVAIIVRPRDEVAQLSEINTELRMRMNKLTSEAHFERMRNPQKGPPRMPQPNPAQDLLREISKNVFNYETEVKKLYGSIPGTYSSVVANPAEIVPTSDGDIFVSNGFSKFSLQDDDLNKTMTVVAAAGLNSVVVTGFPAGVLHEVCIVAISRLSDGSPGTKNSDVSAPKYVWTKPSKWQQALTQQGLKHLVKEFRELDLTTPEKWNEIVKSGGNYGEKSLDPLTVDLLSAAIATTGFISEAEREKLVKDREDLRVTVENVVDAFGKVTTALQEGDPVRDPKHPHSRAFGVVTGPAQSDSSSRRLSRSRVNVKWGVSASTAEPAPSKINALERTKYNIFLSHAQYQAQSQCGLLSLSLRQAGYSVWYDQDAERLESRDMVRGIANSDVFLLYLTKGYFSRYFCRLEATTAMKIAGMNPDKLVVVYETDPRTGFGDADFMQLAKEATEKYPEFFEWITGGEAIPMARRAFQREAMLKEIGKRVDRAGGQRSVNIEPAAKAAKKSDPEQVSQLQAQVQELQAEMFELRSENTALWTAVRKLAKEADVDLGL